MTSVNNENKMYPPLYLTPVEYEMNGHKKKASLSLHDSTIMSVLPQHKTDAIFRVFNTDRYDDRDVVITNLIESYDRLMTFDKKHLNDTFHLDGIQSISARDRILREIISNLLMHRDFSSGYVAKLIIERVGSTKTGYWKVTD